MDPRNWDGVYDCPTCGASMRSASCRAINAHERGKRHREAVNRQGFSTPSGAYDEASQAAFNAYITTPGQGY